MITTYIIQANTGGHYCNKSNNIRRTLEVHDKEMHPHWFANNKRRPLKLVFMVEGDYVSKIKAFGISTFLHVADTRKDALIIDILPLLP